MNYQIYFIDREYGKAEKKWIKVMHQESGRAGNGPKASSFPVEPSISLGTILSNWVNIQNLDTGAGKCQDLWILTLVVSLPVGCCVLYV